MGAGGEETEHIFAKALGNHDGRIIFTRFGALQRLRGRGHLPIELLVGTQRGNHLLASIDFHGDQVAFVAGIGIGDGDCQVARVAKRVPRGSHVKPGKHRRNYH